MSPLRWTTGTLLAATLAVVAVAPAAGQSPAPVPSPATPGASSIPVVTPSLDPAIARATAACAAYMDDATLSAAFSQPVVLAGGNPWGNLPGLPEQETCGYVLNDGTSFMLTSHWDPTWPDGESAALKWGPPNGGFLVDGLPAPAYATTFPDGRAGVAWTPVNGPILTLVLDVTGTTADGAQAPVALLRTFAEASASHHRAAGSLDPICSDLLAIPATSSQRIDGGAGRVRCGYALGGGRAVDLQVEPRIAGDLPDCCTKVPDLGKGAWAQQAGSGKKAPWRLDWILTPGDPAIVGRIENASAARKLLTKAELIDLALQVTP